MGTPAQVGRTGFGRRAVLAMVAGVLAAAGTRAEEPVRIAPLTAVTADYVGRDEAAITQAGCSSCGLPPRELGPPSSDACGGNCVAGGHCQRCEDHTGFGRLYCHLYNAFQCADPCYEPTWVAGANAALFVDTTRPITQMMFRYDRGINMILPDRNEYFWGKIGGGKAPGRPVASVDYNDLYIYNEAGAGRFSAFTVMTYRSWSARTADGTPDLSGSGFGDLTIGTKTLMIDTEYVQLTLQTRTTVPTGSSGKGLGAGHVSLEPSLIMSAKLTPDTYFQGQIAEWVPIGGDSDFGGSIFNYRAALNHVVARMFVDSEFIATLEMVGYCFQAGRYTAPVAPLAGADPLSVRSTGGNYLSVGPGVRWVMSHKCDFGMGVQFAVTEQHFANQLYRFEFRFRF